MDRLQNYKEITQYIKDNTNLIQQIDERYPEPKSLEDSDFNFYSYFKSPKSNLVLQVYIPKNKDNSYSATLFLKDVSGVYDIASTHKNFSKEEFSEVYKSLLNKGLDYVKKDLRAYKSGKFNRLQNDKNAQIAKDFLDNETSSKKQTRLSKVLSKIENSKRRK